MAEIRIEQKQRRLMPWFIGLALVALLAIGLTLVFVEDTGATEKVVPEVGKAHEKKKDETPRHLQQWADHAPDNFSETPEAALIRAA